MCNLPQINEKYKIINLQCMCRLLITPKVTELFADIANHANRSSHYLTNKIWHLGKLNLVPILNSENFYMLSLPIGKPICCRYYQAHDSQYQFPYMGCLISSRLDLKRTTAVLTTSCEMTTTVLSGANVSWGTIGFHMREVLWCCETEWGVSLR